MPLRDPTSGRPSMRTRRSYGTPQHLQGALGGDVPSKQRRALESTCNEVTPEIGIAEETFDLLFQLARTGRIEVERRIAADLRQGRRSGGDGGHAERHRFQERKSETLVDRWKDEHLRIP